ncbi:MAG: 4Fe-4S dicluster domain-containing protein [Bacteroidales bacterium]|nr:4Fe-4S dicluster domain-containing protein [Bacteroidales bacterium]
MLRKIRIILASIFFVGVTLLFLDFTGGIHAWLGWMAKVQLLPAVLAMNFGVVAVLLLLTLLFGRVYCSVICPLGVMQDIISWIRGRSSRKNRFRFRYSPARNWLRYGMLALFIIGLIAGAHSIAILIAPYSAYGRIAANILAPVYQLGNNCLAWIAERAGSYAFYSTEVWIKSVSSLVIAAVTLLIIGILAWRHGRTWCNTICPVGTVLGFVSKFSIFAPVINTEKCRDCGLCGKQCKSSCIDMKEHKIDYSRCVACMDCIDICREGAISYARRFPVKQTKKADSSHEKADQGRRAFMTSAVIATAAVAAKAQEMKTDGGLADISYAEKPQRQTPLVPAGSLSLKNFTDHCTACQLCVSVCPNQVLRPSTSLMTLMQPEMSYERGYCRPECTRCSDICPAGAIRPVTVEEKSSIQIGHAVINLDACVVNTDEVKCGNCARHCPAGAIRMVRKNPDDPDSLMIPTVNEERCIGCGACENLCPARPVAAIHVEGHMVHRGI